jgi:uncharacterized protein YqjF (DUF2071 family)
MPWVSAFPEVNLRLYVEREGRPGVWFLSLDATNPLVVWAARLFRTDIHHKPWPLQPAVAAISCNELSNPHGFALEGEPDLVHFSRSIDVVVWNPQRLSV